MRLLSFLLCSGLLFGQATSIPPAGTALVAGTDYVTPTGTENVSNKTWIGTGVEHQTVAGFAAVSGSRPVNSLVVITDLLDGTDCTTSGGGASRLCEWNGSELELRGDGVGSGGGEGGSGTVKLLIEAYGGGGTVANNTTQYLALGAQAITSGSADGYRTPVDISAAYLCLNLSVQNTTSTLSVTLQDDGVDTAATFTIPTTSGTGDFCISSETAVTIAAGSVIRFELTTSNGGAASGATRKLSGYLVIAGGGGSSGGMADPGGNGVVVRTAVDTTVNRTLTGTAGQVCLADGTGVSGNPIFSICTALDLSGLTSTKPVKVGTTPPATCGVGELFYDSDATSGSKLLTCESTNTWVAPAGGGGGGGGAPTTSYYWTGEPDAGLSNEQSLAGLADNSLVAVDNAGSRAIPRAAIASDVGGLFGAVTPGDCDPDDNLKAGGGCAADGGGGTVTTSGGLEGDGSPGDPVRPDSSMRVIVVEGTLTISSLNLANDACSSLQTVTTTGSTAGQHATHSITPPTPVSGIFVELQVIANSTIARVCNRSGSTFNQSNIPLNVWVWETP